MRVGVNLLNFGPGVSPDALAGWTQLAETLGYHFVMISDHVAMTPDVVARYPAPFYDPFVTLGWLARATRRVELGTTVVILPYRHPLLTARLGRRRPRRRDAARRAVRRRVAPDPRAHPVASRHGAPGAPADRREGGPAAAGAVPADPAAHHGREAGRRAAHRRRGQPGSGP